MHRASLLAPRVRGHLGHGAAMPGAARLAGANAALSRAAATAVITRALSLVKRRGCTLVDHDKRSAAARTCAPWCNAARHVHSVRGDIPRGAGAVTATLGMPPLSSPRVRVHASTGVTVAAPFRTTSCRTDVAASAAATSSVVPGRRHPRTSTDWHASSAVAAVIAGATVATFATVAAESPANDAATEARHASVANLRADARAIFAAAVKSALPGPVISRSVAVRPAAGRGAQHGDVDVDVAGSVYRLRPGLPRGSGTAASASAAVGGDAEPRVFGRVVVIGAGKAAVPMASALVARLMQSGAFAMTDGGDSDGARSVAGRIASTGGATADAHAPLSSSAALPPLEGHIVTKYEHTEAAIAAGNVTQAMPASAVASGDVPPGVVDVAPSHHLEFCPARGIQSGGHWRFRGTNVTVSESSHPVPDAAGAHAGRRILEYAQQADETTLILLVLSGGASALLTAPGPGVSLADAQATAQALLECGASIDEINAIRKHSSAVKGGRLAAAAFPATTVSLILSDVVGDDVSTIASGPTVGDPTTLHDCRRIVDKYGLASKLPPSVLALLRHTDDEYDTGHSTRSEAETPKPGDMALSRARNHVVGSNAGAVRAARREAEARGYNTLVLSTRVEGEAAQVARVYSAIAREIADGDDGEGPVAAPACVIAGGETTVTLGDDHGKGGRNQELALAAGIDLAECGADGGDAPPIVILSGGTDGTDGPTDAAGALVDARSVVRGGSGVGATAARDAPRGREDRAVALTAARDSLLRHDAYTYFADAAAAAASRARGAGSGGGGVGRGGGGGDGDASDGGLLKTGPTGTNVMDVAVILVGTAGSEGASSGAATAAGTSGP